MIVPAMNGFRAGNLRVLAVTGPDRLVGGPELPTAVCWQPWLPIYIGSPISVSTSQPSRGIIPMSKHPIAFALPAMLLAGVIAVGHAAAQSPAGAFAGKT
jgi:hypothetical protein